MNVKLIAGLCLGVGLLPLWAQANDFGDGLANLAPSRILENHDGRFSHWSGIGRIAAKNGLHCTATLIDTRSPSSPADAPAYLLTSGHCVERKNGLIVTDRAVKGTIQFNFFTDTKAQTFALKRIVWSSMQGVDLALVELVEPLNSLIDAGIAPVRIAENAPAAGHDILQVGAPLALGTGHLRLAACTLEDSGAILERPWFWRHTVKNQCRDAKKGGSGSPMLTRENNEVFAVLGTTTQDSSPIPPVELPQGFPQLSADSNYGNPVSFLRRCFVDGTLSQDPEQCPLFPTFSADFKSPAKQYAKISLNEQGQPIYPTWDLHFSLDTPFYRYKRVERASECENPHDYSPAIPAKDARIDEVIGSRTGLHLLCLVGVASADERPSQGLMRNALTLAVELLAVGPTELPKLNISRVEDGHGVSYVQDPRLFSHYTVKIGPPERIDCADPAGFSKARPWGHFFSSQQLPVKMCTQAYDLNGQPSPVRENLLPLVGEKGPPLKPTRITRLGPPPTKN